VLPFAVVVGGGVVGYHVLTAGHHPSCHPVGGGGAASAAGPGSGAPSVGGDAAEAEQAALVYLNAAVTCDCGLTRKLTLPGAGAWCADPQMLAYRDVRPAVFVPASEAGADVYNVAFEMNTTASSDQMMWPGWQDWSFDFTRTPQGWRLRSQGMG